MSRLSIMARSGCLFAALFAASLATSRADDTTEPATPPADESFATTQFKAIYKLDENEVLTHVPPPFPEGRLDFYKAGDPHQAAAIPAGPDAMFIKWNHGTLKSSGMIFGGSFRLQALLERFLDIYAQDVEGDTKVAEEPLAGDFIFKDGATQEELRAALEKMLQRKFDKQVTLTIREVDRKITVFTGTWKYNPIDPKNLDKSGHTQIEIYGADLDTDATHGGGGGTGPAEEMARWIGRWIQQPVLFDAPNLPKVFSWHMNHTGTGTPESRAKAQDPDLVLKHIEEQTGLKAAEETRKVRRLFIEPLP